MAADTGKQDDKWRNKYLDLLDEQDRSEKRFEDRLETLRRGLVQFTLELEGRTPALDKVMSEFRTLLRDEEWPSIHRRIDELRKTFEALEATKQQTIKQFRERLGAWEAELEHDPLSKEEMKRYRKWRKELKSRLDWEHERHLIMGELVALGAHVLRFRRAPEEAQKAAEAGNSFWDFLRSLTSSSDKEDSETLDEEALLEKEGSSEKEAALLPEVGGTSASDASAKPVESADTGDRVQQTLQSMTEAMCRLISRIHFDQDLHMRATTLFNRLEAGIKLPELLPAFEEMVELIMAVVGTKQEAFQKFLSGLNQRLDALQNLMTEAGEAQGSFAKESQALSHSIQQQMQEIRDEVMKKDQSMDSIKDTVLTKMDALMGAMHEYLVKGHDREEHLSQQLDQLNHQVQSLEKQASDAKKMLEEQEYQATIDPLTKVPNRQAYTQRLEQEYQRFKRYKHDLGLLVLDVDHFKNINDTYGHLAGDKVLQLIARTVQKALRETDFIARFGGEEFVILLPEQTKEQVTKVAEKIRSLVEACPFRFKETPVTITVSVGVSLFKEGDTPETVFERADKALYKCKHDGRNRWAFS